MARAQANKLYRNFTKGLITEAGFLTYPEDASTDELNTIIRRKGSRARRLGIDYEPSSTSSTISGSANDDVVTEYHWLAVDNDAALNFLVLQVGATVHFYDTSITPYTAGKKSFTINLVTYKAPTATADQVASVNVHMTKGKSFLFIASEYIEPLVVEYDQVEDDITVVPVVIQIRDFDGVDDGLANDEEPTTLSKEHYYNLQNQGWVVPGTGGVFTGDTPPADHSAPAPPDTSGDVGSYDPYTGLPRTREDYNVP